jgi:hypothetical protein
MSSKRFKDLDEDRKWEIVESHMGDHWYESLIEDSIKELAEHGFEDTEINFTGFWSQGDGASFTCKRIDVPLFLQKHWPEMDFQSKQIERWEEGKRLGGDALAQLGFSEDEAGILTPAIHLFLEMGGTLIYGSVYRSNHHYVHENSTDLSLELEQYGVVEEVEDRDLAGFSFLLEDEQEILDFYEYLEGWMESWMRNWNCEIYRKLKKEYEAWQKELYKEFEEENEEWSEYKIIYN